MIGTAILEAILVSVATPAPDASAYLLRNETPRTFTCGLRRRHRTVVDRFVIRPGDEWRQPTRLMSARLLQCDGQIPTPRWRMRPGVGYRLLEDEMRRLLLVPERVSR